MRAGSVIRTIAVALFLGIVVIAHAARAQIRVGVSLPFTGPAAGIGKEIQSGFDAGLKATGVQGISIVTVDDGCNPMQAIQATHNLVEHEKVAVVVGYPCAVAVAATAPILAEAKTIVLSMSESATLVKGADNYRFQLLNSRTDRLNTLVRLLTVNQHLNSRPATLYFAEYDKNVEPEIAQKFGELLKSGRLHLRTYRPSGDLRDAIEQQKLNPSPLGIFFSTSTWPAQLNALAVRAQSASPITISFPTMPAGFERALKEAPWATLLTNPLPKGGAAAGVPGITGYAPYGFAAAQILGQLVKDSGGNTNPDRLAALLRAKSFQTVLGNLGFDKSGAVRNLHLETAQFKATYVSFQDVCSRPDCHDFEQCPTNCPIK